MSHRPIRRDRYLSDHELARFLAAVLERSQHPGPKRRAQGIRDRALFVLLANIGLRPSEALALRVGDLHLSSERPWLRITRVKQRHRMRQDLGVPQGVCRALATHIECNEPSDHVFVLSKRQAERLFRHYARKAGLTRRHRLYDLRHTAATRLYRHTRDILLVQQILGHSRPDVTSIYTHLPWPVLVETAQTVPVAL